MNWKEELMAEYAKLEKEQAFQKRGALASFLSEFAEKRGLNAKTAQTALYALKKSASAPAAEPKALALGEEIDMEVTGFGHKVVNVRGIGDRQSVAGVIHISNITGKFVTDMTQHFKPGDRIKAKFLMVDPKRGNSFGTRHHHQHAEIPHSSELAEAHRYMEEHVNALSPKALEEATRLIKEFGLFKFSVVLERTVGTFQTDLGLLLLKAVEKNLRDLRGRL